MTDDPRENQQPAPGDEHAEPQIAPDLADGDDPVIDPDTGTE